MKHFVLYFDFTTMAVADQAASQKWPPRILSPQWSARIALWPFTAFNERLRTRAFFRISLRLPLQPEGRRERMRCRLYLQTGNRPNNANSDANWRTLRRDGSPLAHTGFWKKSDAPFHGAHTRDCRIVPSGIRRLAYRL